MRYLKNDELPVMLPDWPGNPIEGKEFQYLDRSFRPEWKVVFRMLMTPNPQGKEKKQDQWRPEVFTDTNYLQDKTRDWIVWLGHASFLIQLKGIRMITDPVLFDLPFISRKVNIPFRASMLNNIDYVLLSHDHRDHCDEKSLKTVLKHNDPVILTSLRMHSIIGKWIANTPYQEAGWYQIYNTNLNGFKITYLPAQHWCRRGLKDFNWRLWGSFMIEAGDRTIYFGADSAFGNHFKEIGKLFPDIDIAILGIGAYKPEFMMKDNHTSPKEAYDAFKALGAKKMLPMHYGTYDLSNEPISEPYRLIQKYFEETEEQSDLLLPGINEVVPL